MHVCRRCNGQPPCPGSAGWGWSTVSHRIGAGTLRLTARWCGPSFTSDQLPHTRRHSVPWIDLAREEREDFAAFLETLSPEQWEFPTLCARWNVRDVVTHSISFDELGGGALVARFLKGWLMMNRINQVGVDDYADRTPEQLIAVLRTHAEPHGMTAGFGGRVALTDNMIHQQDIRRPLGLPRSIEARRLRV